ncbi:hypothetical protein GGQ74_001199 [Desulfobaculum xiamenense]|uniref:Sulfotransferase domain-containing protein n=1 Tax=Desulfobaculum xiamenense TaxID=995050 RepID=A0A846QSC1_9BACT|nr:sulfotransferase domain-containing protein [Desulfobaculum xiamenense]NJB67559.1 hypothetical protein [Desulfobaculum xiamenense]
MKVNEFVQPPFLQAEEFRERVNVLERALEEKGAKIVWLASYPRSGNGMLRALLYFALNPRATDMADYRTATLDLHARFTLEHVQALPEAEIQGTRVVFIKSHFMCNAMAQFVDRTFGAIHLFRNPFEVAVSDFIASEYYSVCHDEKLLDAHFMNYFRYFSAFNLSPTSSLYGYGSWPEHYFSWKKLPLYSDAQVVSLSFADLVGDREKVRHCLEAFGLPVSRERLDWMYEQSRREKAFVVSETSSAIGGQDGHIPHYITPATVKKAISERAQPFRGYLEEKYALWMALL